jgi:hypothetical protein
MSTVAEVRQVSKLVLSRNPELVMLNRDIVLTPIRHVVRSLILDNTSGKYRFRPTWSVSPLFRYNANIISHYNGYLYHPKRLPWDVTNPDCAITLAEEFERIALPIIRPVQTIADFRDFSIEERFPGQGLDLFPLFKIVIDIALGDLESADRQAAALFDVPNLWSVHSKVGYSVITELICPLLARRDIKGLSRQLREWEEQTVKRLKLEKYWQPAPYPVELLA